MILRFIYCCRNEVDQEWTPLQLPPPSPTGWVIKQAPTVSPSPEVLPKEAVGPVFAPRAMSIRVGEGGSWVSLSFSRQQEKIEQE